MASESETEKKNETRVITPGGGGHVLQVGPLGLSPWGSPDT